MCLCSSCSAFCLSVSFCRESIRRKKNGQGKGTRYPCLSLTPHRTQPCLIGVSQMQVYTSLATAETRKISDRPIDIFRITPYSNKELLPVCATSCMYGALTTLNLYYGLPCRMLADCSEATLRAIICIHYKHYLPWGIISKGPPYVV